MNRRRDLHPNFRLVPAEAPVSHEEREANQEFLTADPQPDCVYTHLEPPREWK